MESYELFEHLKKTKRYDKTQLVAEVNPIQFAAVKSNEYYEIMSFKTFVCEIIYNGINLFPNIRKYTIICRNEFGTSYLMFGKFKENVMAKFFGSDMYLILSDKDISCLYCNNRHDDIDSHLIDILIAAMMTGGSIPRISTTFEINQIYSKKILKFK